MIEFISLVVLLLVYLIPSFVAASRGHRNFGPILTCNILLGWTLLGWVASLIWSLTNQEEK